MNQTEIDALLKQRGEEQKNKEQLDQLLGQLKESDFNQNLKSVAFWTAEQRIVWLHSDRKCECSLCGIAASNYYLKNHKKVFACTSCSLRIKE